MISKDFTVINKKGIKLACTIDLPDNNVSLSPYPLSLKRGGSTEIASPYRGEDAEGSESFYGGGGSYALFFHCFTCSKELKAIANINSALTEFGISTVRFDMTGIGSSEGDFKETNFTTQLEDTESVIEYMKEHYGMPELYIGHSLGGAVALFTAAKYDDVKAVVTIAAPSEPNKLGQKLKRTRERSLNDGIAATEIGGVKFEFKPQFFDDLEKYHMKSLLQHFRKPLMVMHSPADTYCDISNASEIIRNASHPKSFVSLDNIDHLMLEKEDALWVGKIIGEWAQKYL
jgi:esterase/lipase